MHAVLFFSSTQTSVQRREETQEMYRSLLPGALGVASPLLGFRSSQRLTVEDCRLPSVSFQFVCFHRSVRRQTCRYNRLAERDLETPAEHAVTTLFDVCCPFRVAD